MDIVHLKDKLCEIALITFRNGPDLCNEEDLVCMEIFYVLTI